MHLINSTPETRHNMTGKMKPLQRIGQWIDSIEIRHQKIARLLCQLIPASCPFARDIQFFGHQLWHIPPLCKLNPLYEQLMGLRFRALTFLAQEFSETVV